MTNTPTNITNPQTKDSLSSDVFIFELPYGYLRYDSLTGNLKDDMQLTERVCDKSDHFVNCYNWIIYGDVPLEANPYFAKHDFFYYIKNTFNRPSLDDFILIEYTQKFDHYILNAYVAHSSYEDGTDYTNKLVGIVNRDLGQENAKQQCLEILINGLREEKIPSLTEPQIYEVGYCGAIPRVPRSFHLKKLGSNSFEQFAVKP